MRILVTNDDGVESAGLHALAGTLQTGGHEVVVVAPSGERSGSGAAIGRLHRPGPIACTELEWPGLPGIPVFALDASPAAAVYAACLGAVGPSPELVVSGINPGANYGHLVLHSGTVGAALTAATLGRPAIAVSIAWGEEHHWETAAVLAAAAVPWVGHPGDRPRVLNLNVPNLPLAGLLGVRDGRLAPYDEVWNARAEPGEVHLEYVGRDGDPDPDTDLALVRAGYASATPLGGLHATTDAGAAEVIASNLASVHSRP